MTMKPSKWLQLALLVLAGAQLGANALKLQLEVLVLTAAGGEAVCLEGKLADRHAQG